MTGARVPRWYLAAMAAVGLVVIAGLVVRHATVARVAPAPAPTPADEVAEAPAAPPSTPWQAPRQSPRLPADPAPPPRVDGATYAARYAEDMCACRDGACIDQVNRAAGGRLGQAGATRATAQLDDAFRRAMTCAREIRAQEAVNPG